jgi:cellulose synthase/poly-beta-1,6-N-acetylglucosamine synthase-like glycosyltransferase
MMPLVSVVMPVRDAAQTIEAAVDSIQAQSWTQWELVAVDDGSTDATPHLLARMSRRDSRLTIISPGSVGLVRALQVGCEAARGTFIARMDADDLAATDRLMRQMRVMLADDRIGLVGAGVTDFGPEAGAGRRRYSAWLNSLRSHAAIVRNMFVECPLAHPTFLLRRSALEAVGGYQDHGWPEDYDLVLRLYLGGWRFGVASGRPLVMWRDWPGRLSRTDARYSAERFRACKMHYLMQTGWLAGQRRIIQWGAGREGKAWLRSYRRDKRPSHVVEVNPKKIGRRIHGVPVIAPEDLPPPGETALIVAVGVEGARDEIRRWLEPRGWREGRDYLFVC